MTTRTLTRTYSAGYTLNARFSALIATTTASVGGIGIVANATATITNSGVVAAGAAAAGVEQHAGILLSAGGEVVNYGAIAGGLGSIGIASSSYIGEPGGDGVYIATGSITNRGTIAGGQGGASGKKGADGGTGGDGVYLRGVGSVTNTAGTISGGAGGSGVLSGGGAGFCAVENAQLANSSVIVGGAGGVGGYGIELLSGASVTNSGSVIGGAGAGVYRGGPGAYLLEGGTIDNSGEIMGGAGGATSPGGTWGAAGIIMGGYGTLTNTGTVAGGVGGLGAGITLRAGGVVANGDTSHTDALVSGYDGVESSDVGMVVNDGVITGSGAKSQAAGVAIDTGVVDNGSLADEAALIRGANGVSVQTSGTVSNYGTIKGSTYGGVVFRGTGSLSNGSSSDTTALIRGYFGVEGAATVDNFATIAASTAKGAFGVSIGLGGYLLNGTAAQVSGSDALVDNGVAVNLGLISGAASQAGEYGVLLFGSSSLTNGKNARIDGYCGVYVSSAGTLINSGTIAATGRRAVRFTSPDGTLIVEAGATFIGGVYGDGCALVMGSGAGTLGGFSDNNVTLSASTPTTTFTDFASLDLDSGTTFSLPAGGTVSGDGTLVAAGSLNVGGTLTNDGVLTLTGTLAGAGSLLINGAAHFDSGSDLAVANVTEGYASATASFGTSNLGYAGLWTQTSGTLSASAGDRVNFTGTGDSFEGTLSGTGTIAFIGGSDTFAGAQLTAASLIINGATVTLSGALGLSGKMSVTTDDLAIASGGASLAGGGVLTLSDFETNKVSGGTLTNVNDLIRGAGALGDGSMGLVNDAGGIIDGDQFAALTIDT